MKLSFDYDKTVAMLDDAMRLDKSFDLVARNIKSASRNVRIYFVDGLIKDEILVKLISDLFAVGDDEVEGVNTAREFADRFIPYTETDVTDDVDELITFILSGAAGIIVEGCKEAIRADLRMYPARSVEEPENNRVLMGPHEGFVETLVFNTAMLRRRIRDTRLTIELFRLGKRTKLDTAVCFFEDKADRRTLRAVRDKLKKIDVNTLSMGHESLLECLVPRQPLNPFPKVRYTERPDSAAASVAEGSIVIFTDCSPAAMIIPTGFFDFMQDTNDFYFPPLIGTLLRWMRFAVFSLTLFMIPLWYLLILNPSYIPEWLSFILIDEPTEVPIIVQLLMVELTVDALKIASLNTPSSLSSSFSIIGTLVLGQFAVDAKWLVSEIVLYMAFVSIASFTQPSFEMGYAFKLSRLLIIILTAVFNLWGFIAGFAAVFFIIATTKTVSGRRYLYPLIPFDKKALGSLLVRKPISSQNN
ncbi:MAG: spore germination protein [Clostridiales bacterium]|nr:spore germination protein [Clostridiales bacterium]